MKSFLKLVVLGTTYLFHFQIFVKAQQFITNLRAIPGLVIDDDHLDHIEAKSVTRSGSRFKIFVWTEIYQSKVRG